MRESEKLKGHLMALFSVLVWGTTFVSTKTLLQDFDPVVILFLRFVLGFVALAVACPRILKTKGWREELCFMGAGLCGVTLYFLFENIALTFTFASNVGVIVSIAPIFTAVLAHFFLKGERLRTTFFIGFVFAIGGIFLISYSGASAFALNPMGDILAVLAAFVWAIYSVIMKKVGSFGYNTIQTTRRTFLYGLVFMIPVLLVYDLDWNLERLMHPVAALNFLFLGLGASALCFATWNMAVKVLGAVKTSVYIYLVPVVTLIFAALVLKEQITGLAALGTGLTLAGLVLSESRLHIKRRVAEEQMP